MIALIWYSYNNQKFKLKDRKLVDDLEYNEIRNKFLNNEPFGKPLEKDIENIPQIGDELIDYSTYDEMGYSLLCQDGLSKHLYIVEQ